MAPALTEVVPGRIWTRDVPHRYTGIEFGHRTTVVRLAGGDLFIHSPGPLDAGIRQELAVLGPARFFACPGAWHDAYIELPFSAYPDARVYAPPDRGPGWKGLPFYRTLGDAPEPEWAADLDQSLFDGGRWLREVVFHHCSSRTLIVADLMANLGADRPLLTRLYARLIGVYQRSGLPRSLRALIRDKPAATRSMKRILGWDFDRIIVGHGKNVESGGKAIMQEAFNWLVE